ncbi:L,D-transpeptidase [Roseobacter sp. HKCCA0434]|uniref:L,D-transpeptidase family protein n=1 Tax=Roseobacter sp. HKCCA0434 TaxID=3079297 RepID=UPI002905DCAE|nr:L,D-transpeptidase [Roseobacter sp. HKCCA0434]
MRRSALLACSLLAATAVQAQEASFSAEALESVSYDGGALPDGQSALTFAVQVLLDRAGISPGVIDGYKGGMSETAIRAFEAREGLEVDGLMDQAVWDALGGSGADAFVTSHTITEEEAQTVPELPEDYAEMAELQRLGYERVSERIAEMFHMDEDALIALNPGASFSAGESVTVAQPQAALQGEVTAIRIDGASGRLEAMDGSGNVVASYPVAVGSSETPSPQGSFEVVAIATEPTYSYRPDVNFQQGDNDEALTLPPGPNGPVGLVWIDLNEPTYGIHGTPNPARLFVEQSHGCVRMSNWDAQELAGMVSAGVSVEITQ